MNRATTVLVVGQLFAGSTCENRRRALERLGWRALGFDTTPYGRYRNRVLRSAAARLNVGPPVRRMNRDVLDFMQTTSERIDVILIDKGKWLWPETLLEIKRASGATLVHFTPDPQLNHHRSRHFQACIPIYDVLFTTKPFEMEGYRRRGARSIHLVHQSYDGSRLYPRELSRTERDVYGADVSFIGHCEPHYANTLRVASSSGARMRVWGPGWPRYARWHRWARAIVAGNGVWADDYARALNATSIGLCFLSKKIPETTTTRSFEIPGCGTFMLAERTEHHLELFREGVEAEFFDNDKELVEKIRFYLANLGKRQAIAAAGYARCLRSGYDDLSRMHQVMALVTQTIDIRHRIASTPNIAAVVGA